MPITQDCQPCLRRLVRLTAELASTDPRISEEAVAAGDRIVHAMTDAAPSHREPVEISTRFLRAIRAITGSHDPFRQRKLREIELARVTLSRVGLPRETDLHGLFQLSVAGNAIDFFRPLDEIEADLQVLPPLAIDHVDRVERLATQRSSVVFLVDNAGEGFFDWPLLLALAKRVRHLTVVVKGGPSQNDLTALELPAIAKPPYPFDVCSNGTDAVGTLFDEVAPKVWRLLESTDLIISKGMANYESLRSGTTASGLPPTAFCMIAKCHPNAEVAGVPFMSRVVMLDEGLGRA